MRPERLVAAGLLVETVAALLLVRAFKPALDVAEPPLARIAPVPGDALPAAAARAVLVILDGLGNREAEALPGLRELGTLGARGVARSLPPTLSRPSYTALLTGVRPAWSGVRTNLFALPVAVDSLPARVAATGRAAELLTDHRAAFTPMFAPHLRDAAVDATYDQLPALGRGALPVGVALRVILFPDVDHEGHEHGADSEEYRTAARHVDGAVRGIAESLDPARDLLVVVADHGHIAAGGHGGLEPEVVAVPLIFVGPGVRAGATIQDATLEDVAPTIAVLLGLPAPGHAMGHALLDVLDAGAAEVARIRANDEARRVALERALEAPLADAARGDRSRRLLRGVVVLVGLAVALALRVRVAGASPQGVVRALLGFGMLLVAGLAVLRFDLSPSRLPPGVSLPGLALVAGLPSLLATTFVLAKVSAGGDRLALRSAALLLSGAGIGAAWVLCCPPFTAAAPPPAAVVGGPLILLASGGGAFAAFLATPARRAEGRRGSWRR